MPRNLQEFHMYMSSQIYKNIYLNSPMTSKPRDIESFSVADNSDQSGDHEYGDSQD